MDNSAWILRGHFNLGERSNQILGNPFGLSDLSVFGILFKKILNEKSRHLQSKQERFVACIEKFQSL